MQKFKALPIQCIEVPGGVILKRGCAAFKIIGDGAATAVQTVLQPGENNGASLEEMLKRFTLPERETAHRLINHLIAKNVLIPLGQNQAYEPGPESSAEDIFYWHFGTTVSRISKQLSRLCLAVLGVNAISLQLGRSLLDSGFENFQVVDVPLLRNMRLFDTMGNLPAGSWPIGNTPVSISDSNLRSDGMDCLIATCDFGGRSLLREWNEYCLQRNRHFLPIVLQNMIGTIGPFVIPGETACYECFLARENANLTDPLHELSIEESSVDGQSVTGFHPLMASVLADVAAFELVRFYSSALPMSTIGSVIEVNLLTCRMSPRILLKVPRCPVCSPLKSKASTTLEKSFFKEAEVRNT